MTVTIGVCIPNRRKGAAAWSPSDLANLEVWLKADAGVLTDVDGVHTWEDQSGNGRDHTQSTGPKKPDLIAARQNGLPGVVADGLDDTLSATWVRGSGPMSVYYVAENGYGNVEWFFSGSSAGNHPPAFVETGPGQATWIGSSTWLSTSVGPTSPHLLGVSHAAGAQKMIWYSNAGAREENDAADVNAAASLTATWLFSARDANHWGGAAALFEFLIYADAHDEATMETVLAYLNDKWAVY